MGELTRPDRSNQPGATTGGASAAGGNGGGGTAPQGPLQVSPEPLHRLNRLEYNNTVRDLLGNDSQPGGVFPVDSALDGFDNLAEGLSLTPALFSLYAEAARELSRTTLEVGPRFSWRKLAKEVASGGYPLGASGWSLYGNDLEATFDLPQEEKLTLSVMAGGTTSNAPAPIMGFHFDGAPQKTFTVMSSVASPTAHTIELTVPAGMHTFRVSFDNFMEDAPANAVNTLVLRDIEITSEATSLPASRALVYTCAPENAPDADACYAQIIDQFARRAWRRTVTAPEKARLLALWQGLSAAEGKETALLLTVRTLLLSPQFLYRASYAETAAPGAALAPLTDFTVASRLSYFLWSSMPDDELLDAAEQQQLRDDTQLAQTVQRMLADPKAKGLLDGFASQWLAGRKVLGSKPNPEAYPGFDEPLRQAMASETQLFFGDFLTNQRPLSDLLTPDFAFVNDRLARHYGYAEPGSDKLVKVMLPPGSRGGILMQGAWLTAQSEPDRTSPVLRGRWLTEQIICVDVPPPPPDVTASMEAAPSATIRERLEAHRAAPRCAACHNVLDPPGLGLEQFDGIGQERTMENGKPIDTSGGIPEGAAFSGGRELAQLLVSDPRFYKCMTHKLMTYGLGRRLDEHDEHYVSEVADAIATERTSLSAALERIVLSPAFRSRSATVN